jgi:hypothetical protein
MKYHGGQCSSRVSYIKFEALEAAGKQLSAGYLPMACDMAPAVLA